MILGLRSPCRVLAVCSEERSQAAYASSGAISSS